MPAVFSRASRLPGPLSQSDGLRAANNVREWRYSGIKVLTRASVDGEEVYRAEIEVASAACSGGRRVRAKRAGSAARSAAACAPAGSCQRSVLRRVAFLMCGRQRRALQQLSAFPEIFYRSQVFPPRTPASSAMVIWRCLPARKPCRIILPQAGATAGIMLPTVAAPSQPVQTARAPRRLKQNAKGTRNNIHSREAATPPPSAKKKCQQRRVARNRQAERRLHSTDSP